MTEAIFGLLGVLIGGVLNGGVSLVMERRAEEREARTAARLLEDEILDIRSKWKVAQLVGVPSVAPTDFPTQQWKQWRTVVASHASNRVWVATSVVYEMAETVSNSMRADLAADVLSEDTRRLLKMADIIAGKALDALRELSKTPERTESFDILEVAEKIGKQSADAEDTTGPTRT